MIIGYQIHIHLFNALKLHTKNCLKEAFINGCANP